MEPVLMKTLSGETVRDKRTWVRFRRKEIMHLLEHYAYGERPVERPDNLTFAAETVSEDFHGLIYKKISVQFSGYAYPVKAFIPKQEKPVPAFVFAMTEGQEDACDLEKEPNCSLVPILDITARGYAVFVVGTKAVYVDCDHKADYRDGIFTVFSPDREKRKDSDWASISAWAWAMSRTMDYIVTDAAIDKDNVAIVGQSRGGKTALWTGATDPRFSLVVSNSSGCLGAAMLRGKTGEHLDFITEMTDWFCANLKKYVENEEMLPIDQHMLLAMMAPRLLYVQSSSLDEWSDPRSERRSCVLASEAYELFGKKGVVLPGIEEEEVQCDTAYHEGTIGYHVRTGNHGLYPEDWNMFMNFWEKKRKEEKLSSND